MIKNERLISADAFEAYIKGLPKTANGHSKAYDESSILNFIEAQPTIEMRKIRRISPEKEAFMKIEADLLKKSFPETKLLYNGEVVVHITGNQYFNLETCESHQEVEYKVLEWLSRGAYKTDPYYTRKDLTRKFHEYMRKGINSYLGTDFSESDMELIYTYLGNGCNRARTIQFFESGFDMGVLSPQKDKETEEGGEDYEK